MRAWKGAWDDARLEITSAVRADGAIAFVVDARCVDRRPYELHAHLEGPVERDVEVSILDRSFKSR